MVDCLGDKLGFNTSHMPHIALGHSKACNTNLLGKLE